MVRVSKDEAAMRPHGSRRAANAALLTMRIEAVRQSHLEMLT